METTKLLTANDILNLSAMKTLIAETEDQGIFGLMLGAGGDKNLQAETYIILMTSLEVVSIQGEQEPFTLVHYNSSGSGSVVLYEKVLNIFNANNIQLNRLHC